MTVLSTTLGIMFFLLHSSSGESGFGQADGFEDQEQDDYELTCYSQLQVEGSQQHTLTCSFNDSSLNSTNVGLQLCGAFMSNPRCEMMTKREKDYFMKSRSFALIGTSEIHVILGKSQVSRKTLDITKIGLVRCQTFHGPYLCSRSAL